MYVCMYLCMYVLASMYVYTYIYIYVCVCVYIYTHDMHMFMSPPDTLAWLVQGGIYQHAQLFRNMAA